MPWFVTCCIWPAGLVQALSVEEGELGNKILDLNTPVQVIRSAFLLFWGVKKKDLQGLEVGAVFLFTAKLQVVSFDTLLLWQDYKRKHKETDPICSEALESSWIFIIHHTLKKKNTKGLFLVWILI